MKRLGVEVEYTSRPQTKGKVEKVIQFIERDFWRWSATGSRVWMISPWWRWYNGWMHEGRCVSA